MGGRGASASKQPTITTNSGTFTLKQLRQRDNRVIKMFTDMWDGKMSAKELHDSLEAMKKKGEISQGEIDARQYDASRLYDLRRNRRR